MSDSPARPSRRRRLMVIALVTLVVGYVVLITIAYFVQERLIFPSHFAGPSRIKAPADRGLEEVWITAPDGVRTVAWFTLGEGRTPDHPGPAVVFAHGNGELIDDNLNIAGMYRRWGVSSLMVEYRGYGRAAGAPGQEEIVGDFIRFHDWMAQRPEVDPARIAFHGRSLGGGVVGALAAQRRPAAVILESTFTSATAMAGRYFMPYWLLRHPFRTDRVIPGLGVPVLVMHGDRDVIIPQHHGRTLSRLIPDARFVSFTSGHNDLADSDPELYIDEIRALLVRAGLLPEPAVTD